MLQRQLNHINKINVIENNKNNSITIYENILHVYIQNLLYLSGKIRIIFK